MTGNEFFQKMVKEAIEDLASGEKGWREVATNTLILACFGMLINHLTSKLTKPLWFFSGCVAAGVIWLIVSKVLGIR